MDSVYQLGRALILGTAVAVTAGSSVLAAATAEEGAPGLQIDIMGAPLELGSTTAGVFLAARHAEIAGDLVSAADLTAQIISDVPDSVNVRRRAHLLMVSAGRLEKATKLASEVVESNPGDPLAIYTLYVDGMRDGRFGEAAELTDKITAGGVNGILVPLLKSWALAGQDRTDEAILGLEDLAGQPRLAPIAKLHQALIADIGGDIGRAEVAFRSALESSGARPSLQLVESFTRFLIRKGETDEARLLVQQFVDQNPETLLIEPTQQVVAGDLDPDRVIANALQGAAEVFRNISGLLNRERLGTEALMFVRLALGLESDNPTALFSLGQLLSERAREDLAINVYRQIGSDTPYSWYARLSIADALHGQEKIDEAVGILQAMADERQERSDVMRTLADLFRIEKQFEEAIEAYGEAFAREDGEADWRLHYTRGIALERAEQWERAEADFLAALALEPDQPLVLNYLGYSWVEQGVELERAKAMIETAVSKRPEDGYITDSLGWVLFRLGDYEGAVVHLERAVTLEPGDPVINDHLGDAYWLVGRKLEARYQWLRALSLEPDAEVEADIRLKLDGQKVPEPLPPGKNRDI